MPGIYVHRIVLNAHPEKRIEKRTITQKCAGVRSWPGQHEKMAALRRAEELQDGFYVNLGIGMPTLVANYVPAGIEVWLQSENGMLGIGPFPTDDEVDADLINAGKQTVTTMPGSIIFGSHDSFAMIRGGKINLSILGAHAGQREGRPGQLDDSRARWSRAWAARWTWWPASSA